MRTLVIICTYNEIDNLPRLIAEILALPIELDVLVVDDNSPDGTGSWATEFAAQDERVRCHHRPAKLGLGSATYVGLEQALQDNYELALTLDADFSHPPRYLGDLIDRATAGADVAIGSRYVNGGGIEGWPFTRRAMSLFMNCYARWLLSLSVRDCSGAYRCYRTDMLRRLDLTKMKSHGYSYLEEILWRLRRLGATFAETPIVFTERTRGQSKINWPEAFRAVLLVFQLGMRNWFSRRPRH